MNLEKELSSISIELSKNPNSQHLKNLKANLLNKKALQLSQQEKFSDAVKIINQGLELNSAHSATLLCNKANFLLKLNQFDESLDCCYEALTIDKDLHNAKELIVLNLNNQQILDSNKGNDQEALKKIEKALSVKSDDKFLLYNKAIILNNLGKIEDSLECIEKALIIDDLFQNAKVLKSTICYQQSVNHNENKSYEEAMKKIDIAIELNPKENSYFIQKCSIFVNLKKYKDALELSEKLLQSDKSNKEALTIKNISLTHLNA